jgi:hypothetical protein
MLWAEQILVQVRVKTAAVAAFWLKPIDDGSKVLVHQHKAFLFMLPKKTNKMVRLLLENLGLLSVIF